MYTPPFHRRILPWIFAAIFMIAAPVAIFYTSGYRWNPKKYKIERNGTLILDSQPEDAKIFLNENEHPDVTPITLQNLTPGNYLIRLEKTGYHAWQKELTIQPEYVTFANTVHLWKISSPVFIGTENIFTEIEASPNEKYIALLSSSTGEAAHIEIQEAGTRRSTTFPLPNDLKNASLQWAEDSRGFIIQETHSSSSRTWLVSLRNSREPLLLPAGIYRWNHSRLEGAADQYSLILQTDGSIAQIPFEQEIIDRLEEYSLSLLPQQQNVILFTKDDPARGFILPSGNWRINHLQEDTLFLQSPDTQEWVGVTFIDDAPRFQTARGDRLRHFISKKNSSFLLLHEGELWHWNGIQNPELLIRESRPLKEAVWYRDGSSVFVATHKQVYALELDVRNGRLHTPLAEFDEIYDIALIKKQLYISATKEGRSGMWTLEIE